jgi:seryl-tRNA synthetase
MPISYGDTPQPKPAMNDLKEIKHQFKILEMDLCLIEKRFKEICERLQNVTKDSSQTQRGEDVPVQG